MSTIQLNEEDTDFHTGVTMVRYDAPVQVVEDPELLEFTQPCKPPSIPHNVSAVADPTGTLHDVLHCIRPLIEWQEDGVLWRQCVAQDVVSREEVARLGETLEAALKEHMARETPICVKRTQLFDEYFSEIIRQVTVECVERGLLLLRVREEIKDVTSYFHGLYQSSVEFGSGKMEKALEGKYEKEQLVAEMRDEVTKLKREVVDLTLKVQLMELREGEIAKNRVQNHARKVHSLEMCNEEMRLLIAGMLVSSPRKK